MLITEYEISMLNQTSIFFHIDYNDTANSFFYKIKMWQKV